MDSQTLALAAVLIASLPVWIAVAYVDLVAILLGILFAGLAVAAGFSVSIWAGAALWLTGCMAVPLLVRTRKHRESGTGEDERLDRELKAAIQTWANSSPAGGPEDVPADRSRAEASTTLLGANPIQP